MSLRRHRLAPGPALSGALSLALVLAGCQKATDNTDSASAMAPPSLPATLPMTNAPPQSATLAPAPAALPRAQNIRTVRVADPRSAYAYADQASYFSQSLGDAPPDYGFNYGDVRPWAWQGYDGSRTFMEPVAGGYRTYYYRPGADRPYFVRDPAYAYGYDGDQLAVVYGPDGAVIPYGSYGPREAYAAAYLWRAKRLYEASRQRQAVSAAAWVAQHDTVVVAREQWAANHDRQAEWAAYHAQQAARESRYWAQEAQRRAADQQRFAQWRQQDFRTPPPPRAIPPHWQQASWAHDSARYAPVAAAAMAGGAAAVLLPHHHQDAAAQRPPMPPQPVAQVAHPAPPQPASRPGWQEQPGPMIHAPRQESQAHSPAPHPEQLAPRNHDFAAPHPPAAMTQQRPEWPMPEVLAQQAAHPKPPHDRPGMTPPPEQGVTVHSGNRGAPHEPPAMVRAPVHSMAPSPVAHAPRPPEVHPAPAMMPHPAPAEPRHETGHPGGGHPVPAQPGGNRIEPHPGGHPDGGAHHDHH